MKRLEILLFSLIIGCGTIEKEVKLESKPEVKECKVLEDYIRTFGCVGYAERTLVDPVEGFKDTALKNYTEKCLKKSLEEIDTSRIEYMYNGEYSIAFDRSNTYRVEIKKEGKVSLPPNLHN